MKTQCCWFALQGGTLRTPIAQQASTCSTISIQGCSCWPMCIENQVCERPTPPGFLGMAKMPNAPKGSTLPSLFPRHMLRFRCCSVPLAWVSRRSSAGPPPEAGSVMIRTCSLLVYVGAEPLGFCRSHGFLQGAATSPWLSTPRWGAKSFLVSI